MEEVVQAQQPRIRTVWYIMFMMYLSLMIGHYAEHVVQMWQIRGMGCSRHDAGGILGSAFPWLIQSEWLHFSFAIVTMIGLIAFRRLFQGKALTAWTIATVLQVWHLIEHIALFYQAQSGARPFGTAEPTSFIQFLWPGMRAELHFFYLNIVSIPMAIAVVLFAWQHLRQRRQMTTT